MADNVSLMLVSQKELFLVSTKLERLFHMDARIRNGSYPSIKTFMERFEVSERTILNDIQFFKDRLKAPLAYSRSHRGYYYTDTDWKLPTFPATEGQLLAFFLSVELTQHYLGTSFEQPLREAIQRITNMLPRNIQLSISELARHYSIRSGASAKTAPETLLAMQNILDQDIQYTCWHSPMAEDTSCQDKMM
jgi:predicted DNA-binding transcriptional regulator YafY